MRVLCTDIYLLRVLQTFSHQDKCLTDCQRVRVVLSRWVVAHSCLIGTLLDHDLTLSPIPASFPSQHAYVHNPDGLLEIRGVSPYLALGVVSVSPVTPRFLQWHDNVHGYSNGPGIYPRLVVVGHFGWSVCT